jgi:DNA-binding NarL/FixJ family response regulator
MGLRRGMRNKEIAYEMNVSEVTVKCYMTTMFRKLGVTNRTQALIVAQNLLLETTPAP